MERRALGKGLSALFPEKENLPAGKITQIPIDQIKPNPFQPREDFDEEALQELACSIKEKGVIQPIIVRRKGDFYELIAGERRLRAAKQLYIKEIPAVIKEVEDEDSLALSLVENIQRQDLNPLEEARAYQYLIDKFKVTQEKLAEIVGKARASVANTLRLLKLPQEAQEELRRGRISFAHARVLLEIEDVNQQRRLVQEIIARGLSVRELENIVKSRQPCKIKRQPKRSSGDPYLTIIEEELQHILATKVRISKRKKRGHIFIEFYSQDDLQRILDILRGGIKQ